MSRPPDLHRTKWLFNVQYNQPGLMLWEELEFTEVAGLPVDIGWLVCSEDISDSTEKAFAREERFPVACDPV